MYKKCVGEPYELYSQAINDVVLAYSAKRKYQAAVFSERQSFYGVSGDQTRATRRDFGDMPIIVLTHAPYPPDKTVTQQEQDQRTAAWEQMHNEVNYDRPEIVIDAIRQALAIAADQGKQPATETTQ